MKNVIICKNCGAENPYYGLICGSCKGYIRERIVNIDLFRVLSLLIHSPQKAFSQIIQAEHKNFIYFILLLASAKFLVDSMYISLAFSNNQPHLGNFTTNYLIISAGAVIFIFLYSVLIKFINSAFDLKSRIRDSFTIFIYALIPQVFAIIILFPVEVTVFGNNLFSNNPTPFTTKSTFAYILAGFEGLMILWSILLAFWGMFTQTKNIIYSVITALGFTSAIFYLLYLSSELLFT
jgi:hypothetical protein